MTSLTTFYFHSAKIIDQKQSQKVRQTSPMQRLKLTILIVCHAASPSHSGMYLHHRPIPSHRIQDFLRYNKTERLYLQDKIGHFLKTSGLKQTNHVAGPVHCINCTGLRVGQWRLERLYRFVHPCLGFEGPSCTLT